MKTVVLAMLSALPFLSVAQSKNPFKPFPQNGIYLSANDFRKHKLTDGFDDGQPGYRLRDEGFRSGVKVTVPNGGKTEIPDSKLWGERKDGVDYRRVDGQAFRVEHADRLFVYSMPADQLPGGLRTGGSTTVYFFSRTATSPIHQISANALKEAYYDQPDKLAAFNDINDLYNDPTRQAAKLVRLFYADDATASTTHRVAE